MPIDLNVVFLAIIAVANAFTAWTVWRSKQDTAAARVASEQGVAVSIANGEKLNVVKEQNDGVISRLGLRADASREAADVAKADASSARAEAVQARAEGDERVKEANRNNEATATAVKEGTQAAVEPIAEAAVAKGAKDALLEKRDPSAT